MLHTETLTAEASEIFPRLTAFKDEFYLAGGTALALQLGHRVSVDFDLFCDAPIKRTLLPRVEEVYEHAPMTILVNTNQELTFIVHGVKHTFAHYPFLALLPFEESGPVPLLSAKEILATKAYTVGRRGSFKDYVDLFVGVRNGVASLQEIIMLATRKYGDAFNDRLFLEQLIYLDDVTEDALTMFEHAVPTKQELISFFSGEIARIGLS